MSDEDMLGLVSLAEEIEKLADMNCENAKKLLKLSETSLNNAKALEEQCHTTNEG